MWTWQDLNMNTNYMNQSRSVIAEHKLPKEPRQAFSTVLVLLQAGDSFTMSGGAHGACSLTTADKSRVRAHWAGYCSNNRGRTVKPGTIRFV